MINGKKRCSKCGALKPTAGFSRSKKGDGFAGWCKACRCADERRRRRDPQRIAEFRQKILGDIEFRSANTLKNIRKRARLTKVRCDLDEEWLLQRLSAGVCELTSVPFDMTGRERMRLPSIDRIIAGGDYTKANCRMIILGLNIAIMTWGLDAFMPVARALVAREPQKA